jgi:hypothetical protein
MFVRCGDGSGAGDESDGLVMTREDTPALHFVVYD